MVWIISAFRYRGIKNTAPQYHLGVNDTSREAVEEIGKSVIVLRCSYCGFPDNKNRASFASATAQRPLRTESPWAYLPVSP